MPGLSVADLPALNSVFGVPGRLSFADSPLGGPVAVLQTDAGRATVALAGGQVIDWQPAGGRPVLWLSPQARLDTGRPVRGGVPVCWPWFGPRPVAAAAVGATAAGGWPQHGFARTQSWSVCGGEAAGGVVRVRLCFHGTAPTGVDWPHAAEATLTVELADTLSLALETHNRGERALPLTQALHSYFRIGDVGRARVEGLDGRRYHDATVLGPAIGPAPAASLVRQVGAVGLGGEVNRIYTDATAPVSIVDEDWRRQIRIEMAGGASIVVWNPGGSNAAALGDMGPEGWRGMVCVECANSPYDVVQIAPKCSTVLRARLSVRQL